MGKITASLSPPPWGGLWPTSTGGGVAYESEEAPPPPHGRGMPGANASTVPVTLCGAIGEEGRFVGSYRIVCLMCGGCGPDEMFTTL